MYKFPYSYSCTFQLNYFEIKVAYKTSVIIQIEQDFGYDNKHFNYKGHPTRIIITKTVNDHLEYISGKGQVNDKKMSK